MSRQVKVTYYFKDGGASESLAMVEMTVNRLFTGSGYESMKSFSSRHVPMEHQEWVTVVKDDGSAVTFRAALLESIEYEKVEDAD